MSVSMTASAAEPTPQIPERHDADQREATGAEHARNGDQEQQRRPAAAQKGGLHDPRRVAAGEPAHAHGHRRLFGVEQLRDDDEDGPGDHQGRRGVGDGTHGASLQEPRRRVQVACPPHPRRRPDSRTPRLPPPIVAPMDVRPEWYEMIGRRISRREFDGRTISPELRERLEVFCDGASAPAGAPRLTGGDAGRGAGAGPPVPRRRPRPGLFTGLIGSYGKVAGTRLAAAFVGRAPSGDPAPDDVQAAAGYLGEALILEATRLGLGTCWIAGSFDKAAAADLADLGPGEQVIAVTPLGYPTQRPAGGERLLRTMVKASARLSVEKIAPGVLDGGWPQWAVSAVQAARLAPSRQSSALALPPGRRRARHGVRRSSTGRRPSTSASRACTWSSARSTRASRARGPCSPSRTWPASRRQADRQSYNSGRRSAR